MVEWLNGWEMLEGFEECLKGLKCLKKVGKC
jgi:hypothetical protein